MVRFLKQFLSSEKGQALPIVLGLLAIGGLTIAVSLNYATTNLNGSRILGEEIKATYAAGAGVEHALWSLVNEGSASEELTENINQMAVTMQTPPGEAKTLYLGELIGAEGHSYFLDVSSLIEWDDGAGAYKYTVRVSSQHVSTIFINEVRARLPVGYSYQPGSAASFPENLSTAEPVPYPDPPGPDLLSWQFPKVNINLTTDPVRIQDFYITGEGDLENYYGWVVTERGDVGLVGEITGILYRITATATHPEDSTITAQIVANVIVEGGTQTIISWQILN